MCRRRPARAPEAPHASAPTRLAGAPRAARAHARTPPASHTRIWAPCHLQPSPLFAGRSPLRACGIPTLPCAYSSPFINPCTRASPTSPPRLSAPDSPKQVSQLAQYAFEPYWPERRLKVCVTGAGGFIGSHVAKRLKSEGHYVVACDWKRNEHFSVGALMPASGHVMMLAPLRRPGAGRRAPPPPGSHACAFYASMRALSARAGRPPLLPSPQPRSASWPLAACTRKPRLTFSPLP